ncbi:hypothetical protein SD37_23250 [Amycolatopsis orientalis]|uniref:Uncharacterized protein n=1 Tax=Amycolatopsis orientalis TaxID=31958 RepID=A0A193CBY8_AMYOR|nr:hypothetical protein SD37_23250 [Amycolatopsis orientalis]
MGMYHPIGHLATLSFLSELAGPYQHHESALLRAIEALEASRAVWREELDSYIDARLRQKRRGRRAPSPGEPPPSGMGGHWYASTPDVSRRAALHALKLWERDVRPDSADPEVRSIVRACIATGGRLTDEQRDIVSRRRTSDETDEVRRPITLVVSASGWSPGVTV